MKQLLEYLLKSLPLLAVVALGYMLFISEDSQISEGMKLSLSALLGAIASYIFIQYSDFIKQIDAKKATHQKALASLEVKLNDQLNWISDIEFHLSNHAKLVEKSVTIKTLIYDSSTYREPVDIEPEIFNVNNLNLKNQLLSLHTSYKKIINDLGSMQAGYKYMLEQAVNDQRYLDSFIQGLPNHLNNVKALREFTLLSNEKTYDILSSCRVLLRDSKDIISKVRRYFIIHNDPKDFDSLVKTERALLISESKQTQDRSVKEIMDVENRLNNLSNTENAPPS